MPLKEIIEKLISVFETKPSVVMSCDYDPGYIPPPLEKDITEGFNVKLINNEFIVIE